MMMLHAMPSTVGKKFATKKKTKYWVEETTLQVYFYTSSTNT